MKTMEASICTAEMNIVEIALKRIKKETTGH